MSIAPGRSRSASAYGALVALFRGDDSPPSGLSLHRGDAVVSLVAFVCGALATFVASGLLDPRLLDFATMDLWFEADIPRVYAILSDRWSLNDRSTVHPIFALLLFPPVYLVRMLLGVDPWTAVRIVYAGVAGVWIAGLFALLRLIGCRRTDAIAFALVGATSAGAMFWAPIPETHTLAAPTIVLAMIVFAAAAHRRIPALIEVASGALTLGVTLTNWMASLLGSFLRRRWWRAALISVSSFALVTALWGAQKRLIPSSPFFLGNPPGGEHMMSPEARGPRRITEAFFLHTIVMPAIAVADRPGAGEWPVMLVQPSRPGSAGVASVVAVVLWSALLLTGLASLARTSGRERLRVYLAFLLAGQFGLHLLFGDETFLYAPDFLSVLIVVAAFATFTRWRRLVVGAAFTLAGVNAIGNGAQWKRARDFFVLFGDSWHDPAASRFVRPDVPRDTAARTRTVLIPPGSRIFDRGFAAPDGGFSPGINQFAIGFWVTGDDGRPITTSDDINLADIATTVSPAGGPPATVAAVTPYYRTAWSFSGVRRWRLDLEVVPGTRLALVVRGIGRRSAPVRRLSWDGTRLLINDRWALAGGRGVPAVLVDEKVPGWATARTDVRELVVPDGWAAARLELGPGTFDFTLEDTQPDAPRDRILETLPPGPAARR
jgi:hypothetical protein